MSLVWLAGSYFGFISECPGVDWTPSDNLELVCGDGSGACCWSKTLSSAPRRGWVRPFTGGAWIESQRVSWIAAFAWAFLLLESGLKTLLDDSLLIDYFEVACLSTCSLLSHVGIEDIATTKRERCKQTSDTNPSTVSGIYRLDLYRSSAVEDNGLAFVVPAYLSARLWKMGRLLEVTILAFWSPTGTHIHLRCCWLESLL